VFISHSWRDRDLAVLVLRACAARGLSAWFGAESAAAPEANASTKARLIASARAVCALVSPSYLASMVCARERRHACSLNKRVVSGEVLPVGAPAPTASALRIGNTSRGLMLAAAEEIATLLLAAVRAPVGTIPTPVAAALIASEEHSSSTGMARLLQAQGKLCVAEPLYREALAARRRTLGDEHPDTLASIYNLAVLLQDQGKLGEAEPLYLEALAARRRTFGKEHIDTLTSITGMARLLEDQGKLFEAMPLFREAYSRTSDEQPNTSWARQSCSPRGDGCKSAHPQ
jgi:tetratricopeptide (TPR) repeat protein